MKVPINPQGSRFRNVVTAIACRPASGLRCGTQERAAKICLTNPTAVSVARAVARWDGNVALQRWGCGRCRPADAGGRGYRFTARRSSSFLRFCLVISFGANAIFLFLGHPSLARDSSYDYPIVSSGETRRFTGTFCV